MAEVDGTPLPDRPAVAVLPFEAPVEDAAQQRLADGFTVDLITELSRFPMLFVTAPNSIFTYKGRRVDNRQVGRELGVHYVLEGSLERQDDRLRVSARLVDAATGRQIWSDRHERAADDLFALRDEVLTQLIGGLTGYEGPMWRSWTEAARRKPTESLTAWDYYLLSSLAPLRRGMNRESVHETMALLEQAVAIDPRFARAWASLADYRFHDALNGWAEDPARAWELFHAAARTAVELDPRDGWAQCQLGRSHFGTGEVQLGAEAWDRALALEPNSVQSSARSGPSCRSCSGSSARPRAWSWPSGRCASIRCTHQQLGSAWVFPSTSRAVTPRRRQRSRRSRSTGSSRG